MEKKPYQIIDLKQNSPEWYEWRRNGIGASEARTALGKNPYQSCEQLLKEKRSTKLHHDVPRNPAAERGMALEPAAREAYIAQRGIYVRPVCVQSIEYPWLRASLDGLSWDGKIAVEIKSGKGDYLAMQKQQDVPNWHHDQLQHIMAVTGLESIDYWGYDPVQGGVRFIHKRNQDFIAELIEKLHNVWQKVQQS